MSTEIKQSPIIAYYLQRLKEVGLTEENNRRQVFNADGRPQTIPLIPQHFSLTIFISS